MKLMKVFRSSKPTTKEVISSLDKSTDDLIKSTSKMLIDRQLK